MRATSTAVSLTAHVVVVVAALSTTAGLHPRVTRPPVIINLPVFPRQPVETPTPPVPSAPLIDSGITLPPITPPIIDGIGVVDPVASTPPASGANLAPATPGSGDPIDVSLVDQLPAILAGPIPSYPDLLRQAGIQGRVVLELVVDTVGHVEPGSIVVVSAAHPGFVAAARQAVAATLFRPARVRGHAVRVRVRIPMEFTLRR